MGWRQETDRPVTIKTLVKFTGESVRLPSAVVEALSQLHHSGEMLGRATVVTGEEHGQRTLDIHLKLTRDRYSRRYGGNATHDELYEALEGAGSERLLIRAHLLELDGPTTRFLALAEDELLPTADLDAEACAAEEEAWLLTTEGEVLGEYAEELHEALDHWAETHGERPRLQYLKIMRDGELLNLQGIQLPLEATLREARALAVSLNEALDCDLVVQLAPRQAERPRAATEIYESVREMARRLGGKV